MTTHPDDFTHMHRCDSKVATVKGDVPYLAWCQTEAQRMGKKAHVRIETEGGFDWCCVQLDGYGKTSQTNNDN